MINYRIQRRLRKCSNGERLVISNGYRPHNSYGNEFIKFPGLRPTFHEACPRSLYMFESRIRRMELLHQAINLRQRPYT